ncbi:DUF885 family protein [Marinitenerispora sediminis]|uniref:DUF885 domain-containing protein n=1 Tax=Marinitenerispora sediminis TaxID=1931232 RepID=A0A368TER6_9ACTN|nr:DUF885 family protein [Marinitenerispora sediminis]RCV51687.1 DUF885 domain-containing protein [Marinitenerispora sediminis]RCV58146.1 DUF885 domain-containing protein [Marinitenerispora sediminis]RCV62517.1 DUF885 domain-containing protein [Marinitenerispora sediminis]
MDDLTPRLRAIADLTVATTREEGGRHEYDGRMADLSPEGVRAGLARLGAGDPEEDPHDEAHLAAVERGLRYELGELELHRSNPNYHLGELDLSGYDKAYAPEAERRAAVERHLAAWPDGVDAAIASLDRVSAPVATALLAGARGLAEAVPADVGEGVREPALAAHRRLVAHLERAAAEGDPSAALGGSALARLMATSEAAEVDLGRLAERADAERDRLMALLAESAARIDPDRAPLDVARSLVRDHPDAAGVLEAARAWTEYAIAFTRERDLVPYHDGECVVTTSPASRRWATAMLSWSAPAEPDGPTYYYVTPPDPAWSAQESAEWLEMFSSTTLPGITVHEVAPGHFSHGRALRRAPGQVRRTLFSMSFAEGWAHYAEEMCLEEGFAQAAARAFADSGITAAHLEIGTWLEALIRVTRLASAIGVHTGAMTVEESARRFTADTHLAGPAALAEAERAAHDPTYGCYTWGKLEILDLRERARARWGADFTLKRFHTAMLDLGSPPLGLLGTALERG